MGIRCGIDLGTSYSAISWYDPDSRRVESINLETSGGTPLLRSMVFYEPGGQVIVGEAAYHRAYWHLQRAIIGVKHRMGNDRSETSPEIRCWETLFNEARQHLDRMIVGVKRSMGDDWKTAPIDGRQYSPQEISAEILKVLKADAEKYLGEPVQDVVITVPAYFGDKQRAATLEAGRLAGLNVLALMPEPHAAALAFAIDRVNEIADRALLVYDLGGGTFDVTLIRTERQEIDDNTVCLKVTTLCKDGDCHLGGLDWDYVLSKIVAQKIQDQYGVDPLANAAYMMMLLKSCERAKRELSRMPSTIVMVDAEGYQVEVEITRDELEQESMPLLFHTEALLRHVLEMAEQRYGLRRDQIDVLLCGGSTLMPMVEQMIIREMGKPPLRHRSQDLVSMGAAYMAYLSGTRPGQEEGEESGRLPSPQPSPRIIETRAGKIAVTPGDLVDIGKAVGMEVIVGYDVSGNPLLRNVVVIPADAPCGQLFERNFTFVEDGTGVISLVLYEGTDADPARCIRLGSLIIHPKGRQVELRIGYDLNGVIHGEKIYVETGLRENIFLNRQGVDIQLGQPQAVPLWQWNFSQGRSSTRRAQ